MADLAPEFYQRMINDETLQELLADYEFDTGETTDELPAVYQVWGQRSHFPYTIFKMRSAPSNHWNKRKFYLELDHFDTGESTATIKDIMRRVKNMFHKLKICDADGFTVTDIELETQDTAPTEEEGVIHFEQVFEVWAWDKQFVEESENV